MGIEVDTASTRSTFVSVVAWIFIVLSGFGTLIAVFQNVMFFTMFDNPDFQQALHAPPVPGMPPMAGFMLANLQLFFLANMVVMAAVLACSIGLLRRVNWARPGFVGLLVLGIVWNLGGLVFQLLLFSSMQDAFGGMPDDMNARGFMIAISVMAVLFAVGLSVLYGWIAKRLLSPAIAAEFRALPTVPPSHPAPDPPDATP